MLEPREAEDVYAELSKLVRAQGLDWLIADVYPDTFPQRRGRKAAFVVTRPFTEREKLSLLIEALEAASVGLSLGILNTYETIGEVVHGLKAIGFAPDAERGGVVSVTPDILGKKDNVLRLEILLRELKDSV